MNCLVKGTQQEAKNEFLEVPLTLSLGIAIGKPTGCRKLQPVKNVLATFFLLIFSFQVVPVKEIGKILFKGTMVEEIHETSPDGDDISAKVKKAKEPFVPHPYIGTSTLLALRGNGLGILSPKSISKQHIPDIITPPPNRA